MTNNLFETHFQGVDGINVTVELRMFDLNKIRKQENERLNSAGIIREVTTEEYKIIPSSWK